MSAIVAPRFRVFASPHRSLALVRLRLLLRVFAVALAALQAWNGRFLLNPDGVSYLDIADAYLRADWHNAVSTYWSPLYSWLLSGALVLHPLPAWENAAVKLVNFVVFLGALAAFERLLRELTRQRPARAGAAEESASLPRGVSLLVGYALFLGSSCVLTSVAYVSPDLLVSAFVYLLAAETMRAGRAGTTPVRSLTFGLLLGLGCLAKAVLLPVGLVFLAASAFRTGSFRKAVVHVTAAAAVLLIVFGGFVAAMSAKAGRFTLGDVSRLNYLWIVNGVPDHGWLTDDPRLARARPPAVAAAVRDPRLRVLRAGRRHLPLVERSPGLVRRPDVALRRAAAAGGGRGGAAGLLLHLPVAPGAVDGRPRRPARWGLAGRRRDVPRTAGGAAAQSGLRLFAAAAGPRGLRPVCPRGRGTTLPGGLRRAARPGPASLRPLSRGAAGGIRPLGVGRGRRPRRGADAMVGGSGGRRRGARRDRRARTNGPRVGGAVASVPAIAWPTSAARLTALGAGGAGPHHGGGADGRRRRLLGGGSCAAR